MESIKHFIDYLSAPTISFTLLTVLTPLLFPPTDWFDKISRKLGFHKVWTKSGVIVGLGLLTVFMIMGYTDPNFSKLFVL